MNNERKTMKESSRDTGITCSELSAMLKKRNDVSAEEANKLIFGSSVPAAFRR